MHAAWLAPCGAIDGATVATASAGDCGAGRGEALAGEAVSVR
jgi:hypothetical protein